MFLKTHGVTAWLYRLYSLITFEIRAKQVEKSPGFEHPKIVGRRVGGLVSILLLELPHSRFCHRLRR